MPSQAVTEAPTAAPALPTVAIPATAMPIGSTRDACVICDPRRGHAGSRAHLRHKDNSGGDNDADQCKLMQHDGRSSYEPSKELSSCVGPSRPAATKKARRWFRLRAQKIAVLIARLDPGELPPDMDIDVSRSCEMMRAFATAAATPRSHRASWALDRCLTASDGKDHSRARWACNEFVGDLRRWPGCQRRCCNI